MTTLVKLFTVLTYFVKACVIRPVRLDHPTTVFVFWCST